MHETAYTHPQEIYKIHRLVSSSSKKIMESSPEIRFHIRKRKLVGAGSSEYNGWLNSTPQFNM
jgi:hypothetical protein